jgi:glycosyltransferase involved in cell wall biosynthesis
MGAPSARVYELSRHWVEKGSRVTVLTGFPNHPTGVIPPEYKQHIFKREIVEGIEVVRTYIYPAANKGFFRRILNYFSFLFSSLILGIPTTHRPDVVIATSPQFFVAIAGYIFSKIKRCPFVLEIRDLWPESIVQLEQLKNKFLINLLRKIELFLYRHATEIVIAVDSFANYLEHHGIPTEKIHIIRNGVDLDMFKPQKDSLHIKNELAIENKFIVSYIGTHGLSHALDKVMDAANLLKPHTNIHILLIGEGAEKDKLIQKQKDLQLTNITFLNQIPKDRLPYYYSLSDAVLVTLRKIPLFMNALPSKMFEIMAMKRPMILAVDGEAREVVANKAHAAIFVEPEDPEGLKRAILKLSENEHLRKTLGENGRNFVELYFDRKKLAESYLNILKQVLTNKNN